MPLSVKVWQILHRSWRQGNLLISQSVLRLLNTQYEWTNHSEQHIPISDSHSSKWSMNKPHFIFMYVLYTVVSKSHGMKFLKEIKLNYQIVSQVTMFGTELCPLAGHCRVVSLSCHKAGHWMKLISDWLRTNSFLILLVQSLLRICLIKPPVACLLYLDRETCGIVVQDLILMRPNQLYSVGMVV